MVRADVAAAPGAQQHIMFDLAGREGRSHHEHGDIETICYFVQGISDQDSVHKDRLTMMPERVACGGGC